MTDANDTQDDLIMELTALRQQVAQLQAAQTEWRQTESVLSRREARYRHLVESSLGLMCTHDLKGQIVSVNPAAAHALGYHPSELSGQSLHGVLAPQYHTQFQAYLNRIRVQPRDIGVMRVRTKAGQERIWSYRNVRVDEPGEPSYVVGHAQDITDLICTQQTLKHCANPYRLVVEGSIQGLYVHQDGIIQLANAALARVFGYDTPEDLIGQDYRVLVAPHEIECLETYHAQRLQGLQVPQRYEYQGIRRDGTLIWLESLVSLIPWDGDSAMLTTLLDLTECKRLEADMHQAQKMQAMGMLAGGIVHDFNNLLGVIGGYTELMQPEVGPDSTIGRYVQEVLGATTRAKDLVRRLLSFGRQADPERKLTHLHRVVREALSLLRVVLPPTISVEPRLDPKAGPILADPSQLHQVLMNLCLNAEYAMRQRGGRLIVEVVDVEVATEVSRSMVSRSIPPLAPGPYVQLSIRDTGHGIAPEVLARMFEPFYTTKGAGEGTGMGLAVVQDIVRDHGGAIAVRSILGAGSVFHLYFPRIEVPGQ